jgi:hypothetical protein
VGLFQPLIEHLNVKIKTVRYSPLQKAQTLIASILLGCPHTSAINHRLVPDRVAAQQWGRKFPNGPGARAAIRGSRELESGLGFRVLAIEPKTLGIRIDRRTPGHAAKLDSLEVNLSLIPPGNSVRKLPLETALEAPVLRSYGTLFEVCATTARQPLRSRRISAAICSRWRGVPRCGGWASAAASDWSRTAAMG